MINNTRFLRRVIAMDAIATSIMALSMVVAAQPLSILFGLPSLFLTITGLLLLPFAAWVGWLASQYTPPRKLVWLLIASNAVWIADSLLLLFGAWTPLTASVTPLGTEFIAIQTLLTMIITALEFAAVKRTVLAVT
jgi:hypothetical protein